MEELLEVKNQIKEFVKVCNHEKSLELLEKLATGKMLRSKLILKIAGVNVIFNNTNLHEVSISENNIAQKDIYNSSDLDDSNFSDGDTISIVLNDTTTLTLSASVSASGDNDLKNQIMDAINNNSNFSDYEAYLDTSNNLVIKSNIAGEEGTFDISISVAGNEMIKNSN